MLQAGNTAVCTTSGNLVCDRLDMKRNGHMCTYGGMDNKVLKVASGWTDGWMAPYGVCGYSAACQMSMQ